MSRLNLHTQEDLDPTAFGLNAKPNFTGIPEFHCFNMKFLKMGHPARESWRKRETIPDASLLIIAELYCWNVDGESRNGKSGTLNKQAQHPGSCIAVR